MFICLRLVRLISYLYHCLRIDIRDCLFVFLSASSSVCTCASPGVSLFFFLVYLFDFPSLPSSKRKRDCLIWSPIASDFLFVRVCFQFPLSNNVIIMKRNWLISHLVLSVFKRSLKKFVCSGILEIICLTLKVKKAQKGRRGKKQHWGTRNWLLPRNGEEKLDLTEKVWWIKKTSYCNRK